MATTYVGTWEAIYNRLKWLFEDIQNKEPDRDKEIQELEKSGAIDDILFYIDGAMDVIMDCQLFEPRVTPSKAPEETKCPQCEVIDVERLVTRDDITIYGPCASCYGFIEMDKKGFKYLTSAEMANHPLFAHREKKEDEVATAPEVNNTPV